MATLTAGSGSNRAVLNYTVTNHVKSGNSCYTSIYLGTVNYYGSWGNADSTVQWTSPTSGESGSALDTTDMGDGWYEARGIASDGSNEGGFGITRNFSELTSTKTVTIKFSANGASSSVNITIPVKSSYTATYYPNGASGSNQTQTYYHGAAITTKPSSTFSRTGYTFKQWNTSQNGTGTVYNANTSYTPNTSLSLYAIWNRTVTYDANGHGTAPTSKTAVATTSITLESVSESGWKFLGWYTEASGGTKIGDAGYNYTGGTVTLYAHWKKLPMVSITDTIRASEYESNVAYNPIGTGELDDDLVSIAYDPLSSKYTGHIIAASFEGTTISNITAKVQGDSSATTLTLTNFEVEENDANVTDCKLASGYLLDGRAYSQDFTVVYRVTDSDGDYDEFTVTVPKTPNYTSPTVGVVSCERCKSNGDVDDEGTYLKIVFDVDTYVLPMVGNPSSPIASDVYDRRLHLEFKLSDDRIAFNENLDIDETISSTSKRISITKKIGLPHSYYLTQDESIDSGKTYYALSGGSYSAVAEPDVADIATYYEQSSTPWLFDENTSYKAAVKVYDGVNWSPTIIELISSAFFTMDVLSDAYRGEYVVTQVTSLENMSLDSNHKTTSFYKYYNGRYVDVTTGDSVLPLAVCDYTDEDATDRHSSRLAIGDSLTIAHMPSRNSTLNVEYNAFYETPPGFLGTMDFDVYESTFAYGTPGTDGAFYYDGDRTFTLVRVPSRDYVMNLEVNYTYPDIDYDNPGYISWFARTDDFDVDPDKTYYIDNPNFIGNAWCEYRMVEVQSPIKTGLFMYYEDVTETLDPSGVPWYERDPNPTGPRPGHGISFGAPCKEEGFHVHMAEYHYDHAVLPVYKGNAAPTATDMLWIDTSAGRIMKYHDGTDWVCVGAVWG